jgi:hypothetical protein
MLGSLERATNYLKALRLCSYMSYNLVIDNRNGSVDAPIARYRFLLSVIFVYIR